MIHIKTEDYIAEGEIRKCYYHPSDTSLCIKIPKPEVTQKYVDKELIYFHKISKKKNFDYPFFSDYKGSTNTNLGIGYLFDLIRDETTNNVSLTLRHYLENKLNNVTDDMLKTALLKLKQQMIAHKIFTRDLRPRNICCKILHDGSLQMIIIDGIGHRDFFPLADYFKYFAKSKVERAFEKFELFDFKKQRNMFKELRKKGATII